MRVCIFTDTDTSIGKVRAGAVVELPQVEAILLCEAGKAAPNYAKQQFETRPQVSYMETR